VIYLAGEIFAWLLAAFLLGLLIGWWIWGKLSARISGLEADLATARREADDAKASLRRCEADLVSCNDKLKAKVDAPVAAAFAAPAAAAAPLALFLSAPDGVPDDLMLIKGIGPKLNKLLNTTGIFHFRQIASWSAADIETVDAKLEMFKGRIARDEWVAQAKLLAAGNTAEFERLYGKMGENNR
jgi:predicted flap endonuclease-1-like 5' DNA nuclease